MKEVFLGFILGVWIVGGILATLYYHSVITTPKDSFKFFCEPFDYLYNNFLEKLNEAGSIILTIAVSLLTLPGILYFHISAVFINAFRGISHIFCYIFRKR